MKEVKRLVTGYIEDIWNGRKLELLPTYLHSEFIDHSLPLGAQNALCVQKYLLELQKAIYHHTEIESITYDSDFAILKVTVTLKASPPSDEIPSHQECLYGYRILAISDQRIIAHWEFFQAQP